MNWWTVPRLWERQTVAILASGASMTPAVADAVREAAIPTIAINSTYLLAPWAGLIYGADVEWWENNPAALALPAIKVCCLVHDRRATPPGVQRLRMTERAGLETRADGVRSGSNSGYQAINVAYLAGATRVLLCGYNMSGPNWHGKHKAPLRNTADAHYVTWRRLFDGLAADLAKTDCRVINCTENTSLDCFPKMSLESALEETRAMHDPPAVGVPAGDVLQGACG